MPGTWLIKIDRGVAWNRNISFKRNGIQIVPTAAVLTVNDRATSSSLMTLSNTEGHITIIADGTMQLRLTVAETNALSWNAGLYTFVTTEADGRVTKLLAGQASVN